MLRTGLRGLGVTEDKMLGSGWGLWDGQQEAWSCAASRKKCGCRGHRESWAFETEERYAAMRQTQNTINQLMWIMS